MKRLIFLAYLLGAGSMEKISADLPKEEPVYKALNGQKKMPYYFWSAGQKPINASFNRNDMVIRNVVDRFPRKIALLEKNDPSATRYLRATRERLDNFHGSIDHTRPAMGREPIPNFSLSEPQVEPQSAAE